MSHGKRGKGRKPPREAAQAAQAARVVGEAVHSPWKQGLLVFLVAYGVGLALRLVEAPLWLNDGGFRVYGQWLMATHDAYNWLSGTEGGPTTGAVIPRLLLLLSGVTGVAPANLGFWLPAFLAPLAALPVCLVAARWGMPWPGLWAGVLAVAVPGYLQRTRLGFLDDDMLVIPTILMLIAGFVLWLTPYCRETWGRAPKSDDSPLSRQGMLLLFLGALALGLWARLCVIVYLQGFFLVLVVTVVGTVLFPILARPHVRLLTPLALVVLFTAWFASPLFILAVVGLTFVAAHLLCPARFPWPSGPWVTRPIVWVPPAILALALAVYGLRGLWLPGVTRTMDIVFFYYAAAMGRMSGQEADSALISEALGLSAWQTAQLLSGHWIVAVLGTAGFAVLLWKQPLAAMFLPLGGIAAGAFFLGARFTVISGAFFGLGLGCGAVMLLDRLGVTRWLRWPALLLPLPLLLWYPWLHVQVMKPEPVISAPLAKGLMELRSVAWPDALVWNWWDLGHGTLYYSSRAAVDRASPAPWYPRAVAVGSQADLQSVLRSRLPGEHYVVVAWELMDKASTILAVGAGGTQADGSGKVQRMEGQFYYDMAQGFLIAPDQRIPLQALTVIEAGETERHHWPWHAQGGHVVLNRINNTGYYMDHAAAQTMFIRLLLNPPPGLDLVVDDFPWVRIYRSPPGSPGQANSH